MDDTGTETPEEHSVERIKAPASGNNLPAEGRTEQADIGALAGQLVSQLIAKVPGYLQKTAEAVGLRLIKGGADYAAVMIETAISERRSKQAAKEETRRAITAAAAQQIQADPALRQRAAEYFLAEYIHKQRNREVVVELALEQLQYQPASEERPTAEPPPLDEDWLSGFARVAENATSDRARRLFAKVLAGEIRQPGQFSLFTLDFLERMSQREADMLVQIAPFVVSDMFIRTARIDRLVSFEQQSKLAALGILAANTVGGITASSTRPLQIVESVGSRAITLLVGTRQVLLVSAPTEQSIILPCSLVTEMGQELLSLYECDIDAEMTAEIANILPVGVELVLAERIERGNMLRKGDNVKMKVVGKVDRTSSPA